MITNLYIFIYVERVKGLFLCMDASKLLIIGIKICILLSKILLLFIILNNFTLLYDYIIRIIRDASYIPRSIFSSHVLRSSSTILFIIIKIIAVRLFIFYYLVQQYSHCILHRQDFETIN